jgi:hypothetical protein
LLRSANGNDKFREGAGEEERAAACSPIGSAFGPEFIDATEENHAFLIAGFTTSLQRILV